MTHKCGWCGQKARTEAPVKGANVSQGICSVCLAAMLEEVFGVGRTEKRDSQPLPRHFEEACATV